MRRATPHGWTESRSTIKAFSHEHAVIACERKDLFVFHKAEVKCERRIKSCCSFRIMLSPFQTLCSDLKVRKNCRQSVCLPTPAIFKFRSTFLLGSLSAARALSQVQATGCSRGQTGLLPTAPVAGRMRGAAAVSSNRTPIPGRANRWTARFVRRVMLGFQGREFVSKGHTEITGTPIRTELKRLDRSVARKN